MIECWATGSAISGATRLVALANCLVGWFHTRQWTEMLHPPRSNFLGGSVGVDGVVQYEVGLAAGKFISR